jgi:hypothetical protein
VVGFEFGAAALGHYGVAPADMAQLWKELGYQVQTVTGRRLSAEEFIQSSDRVDLWDYVAVPAEEEALAARLAATLAQASRGLNLARVRSSLRAAADHAPVGQAVPSMGHHRPLMRFLARRAAAVVMHLARPVTNPQRQFNAFLLDAAGCLAEDMDRLLREVDEGQRHLREAERSNQALREQLARQEERLRQLEARLARTPWAA